MPDIRRILVPTDFSKCAAAAVDAAVGLARRYDAELFLMHVVPPAALYYVGSEFTDPVPWYDAAMRGARSGLDKEESRIVWPKVHTILRQGSVEDEILREADAVHADLIVIGTRGRSALAHALLGSVAERVIRISRLPVMTVRATENPAFAPR